MEQLTSRQNRIIAHLRRLGTDKSYRHACGEFVCDTPKLLAEALLWGGEIGTVLWAQGSEVLPLPEGVRQYTAPRELVDYASPLSSSAGPLFTVRMKTWELAAPGRTLVAETIQDPGNLGTILRTANALNIDTVILTGDCADVYNPKTVRASMGAVFRQRRHEMSREQLRAYLTEHGFRLYGAALSETAEDIRTLDLSKAAVAIGSEGRGLSNELLSLCDGRLIIPMNAQCESLNAAVAAAIVMWELCR
ncbi:MAG: TrmH family RNA methyltransferase [Oscillospiraceae bacterium]